MKNNRNGQSAILTDADYCKIRRFIKQHKYRLMLDIAWFTGERWGAIVQLQVLDVYFLKGDKFSPLNTITFRANTRKASPDGRRQTRQVSTNHTLFEALQAYQPPADSIWLFPSRCNQNHITLRNADWIFREAVSKSGLVGKGISTHSTRRSFISHLYNKGVDIYTIQHISGHKDLKALRRYVEISPNRVEEAINLR